MPSAAAFALNASRSDLRTALLVPFTAGGLESSTNQFVAVSFAAPPIGPEPDPFPAAAGATARPVRQRSVTASRRNLLNFPPVQYPIGVRALPRPPSGTSDRWRYPISCQESSYPFRAAISADVFERLSPLSWPGPNRLQTTPGRAG